MQFWLFLNKNTCAYLFQIALEIVWLLTVPILIGVSLVLDNYATFLLVNGEPLGVNGLRLNNKLIIIVFVVISIVIIIMGWDNHSDWLFEATGGVVKSNKGVWLPAGRVSTIKNVCSQGPRDGKIIFVFFTFKVTCNRSELFASATSRERTESQMTILDYSPWHTTPIAWSTYCSSNHEILNMVKNGKKV